MRLLLLCLSIVLSVSLYGMEDDCTVRNEKIKLSPDRFYQLQQWSIERILCGNISEELRQSLIEKQKEKFQKASLEESRQSFIEKEEKENAKKEKEKARKKRRKKAKQFREKLLRNLVADSDRAEKMLRIYQAEHAEKAEQEKDSNGCYHALVVDPQGLRLHLFCNDRGMWSLFGKDHYETSEEKKKVDVLSDRAKCGKIWGAQKAPDGDEYFLVTAKQPGDRHLFSRSVAVLDPEDNSTNTGKSEEDGQPQKKGNSNLASLVHVFEEQERKNKDESWKVRFMLHTYRSLYSEEAEKSGNGIYYKKVVGKLPLNNLLFKYHSQDLEKSGYNIYYQGFTEGLHLLRDGDGKWYLFGKRHPINEFYGPLTQAWIVAKELGKSGMNIYEHVGGVEKYFLFAEGHKGGNSYVFSEGLGVLGSEK